MSNSTEPHSEKSSGGPKKGQYIGGQKTLKEIAEKMREIDYCMMTTTLPDGDLASRPMSTNGDVEYSGHSYLFSSDKQDVVKELEANPHVNLSFTGEKKIFGGSKLFISVVGVADLVRDREQMKKHWTKDLEVWFEDGIDTPGIVMIHVTGKRVKYWEDWESGEVKL